MQVFRDMIDHCLESMESRFMNINLKWSEAGMDVALGM